MARGTDLAGRRAVTYLKGGDRTPGRIPEPGMTMLPAATSASKRRPVREFAQRTSTRRRRRPGQK